jgi:hypothetical protein
MLPSMLRKYYKRWANSQDTVMPLEEMHGSYYDLLEELTYTNGAEKGVAIVFQQQEIAQQMPENCSEIDFLDLGELTLKETLMDLQVDDDIADNIANSLPVAPLVAPAQQNFVQPVAAIPIDRECAYWYWGCHCLTAECGRRTREFCQSLIKNKIEVPTRGSDAWKADKKARKHQRNQTYMKRQQDEVTNGV